MDRLEAMSILLEAVEAGSLSAAGRRLGMPLATVSRKVSDLEARLGAQLLRRSSRKLTLTDAGQSYVLASKSILEQVAEAERAAAGEYSEPRGDLTIAAPIVLGRLHVLPLATAFLAAHSNISIRLVQGDRLVNLQEEHVDLAIRIGALPDSGLTATRLGVIRRVVCGSPAYFASRGTPAHPDDLGAHDGVAYEGMTQPDGWVFRDGARSLSAAPRFRLRVNTTEAAIDAAIAGIGVTRVLSYQTVEAFASGALATVLDAYEPEPWPVHLIYPARTLLPRKTRAFIDFVAPRLRERLRVGAP